MEEDYAIRKLSKASSQFGVNLYKASRASADTENILLSPFCLHSVLSMVYLGAQGQTKTQIQDVLKLDVMSEDELGRAYKASLMDNGDALLVANRLYVDKDKNVNETFSKTCNDVFKADTVKVDFKNASSESETCINGWVDNVTNGKVKEIITPNSLEVNTSLVLINAIYFKDDWDVKFDPALTESRPFQLSQTNTVDIPFMTRTGRYRFVYSENLNSSAVEIPYKNKSFSLFIVLPSEPDGLSALEEKITDIATIKALADSMSEEQIELSLPKFSVSSSMRLTKTLSDLGMEDSFIAGKADLSGIDGSRNLFVSDVLHKVVIDINEDGTEASAAGAVGISTRMLPQSFCADHPFLYFIRNNKTRAALFLGRYVKPAN